MARLRTRVAGLLGRGTRGASTGQTERTPRPADDIVLDNFTGFAPSPQEAVDTFVGQWVCRLPAELGVVSGEFGLFEDSRIERTIEWLGGVRDMRVLELGPYEGGHTYMLERAGATIDAVESNSRSYLKCLVVKELLGLTNAHFLRGDFVAYLRQGEQRYDLVLASGVLYHMAYPLELLDLLAKTADRLAIWTHYYDEDVLAEHPTSGNFRAADEVVHDGRKYRLHPRLYLEMVQSASFGGGLRPYARWMEREDILDRLRQLGFTDLDISHEQPDHMNGPSFLVLARRPS